MMNSMENRIKIRIGWTAACVMIVLNIHAQSALIDYDRQIDLGLGISQSQLLSTAATQTITGEELQKTAAISLKDALYGRLLGLTALKNGGFSGDYGYGANMNIRGTQTTSENNMLILVDGIKRGIDYMTVEEVESVTVLRDAASVALLGYEGVNGAILVKTKRGRSDKQVLRVSYDHKFTFNPKVADFVDAYTYANAMNKARANDGLSPMYNAYELKAFADQSQPYYYPNVDWEKEMFRSLGSEDQVNISMQGGNELLTHFTMIDYTDSRGMLKNTEQDLFSSQLKLSKANIRTNIDVQLTSSTTMQVNALGSFSETNRPVNANANGLTAMLYQVPASAFPVKNDSTGLLKDVWGGNTTYGTNNVAAQIQSPGFLKTHARLFQGDVTLTQDLSSWLSGLSVSARFGYNNFVEIYEQNRMGEAIGFLYGYQRPIFDAGGQPTGDLTTYQAGDMTNRLAFSRWNNQHNRSAYLHVSGRYATSLTDDDHFITTLIWQQSNQTSNGQYVTFNRMNWIANLHYDLKQKYVADVVLALNGSNRSYPQKWSFAPTVSLGYIYAHDAETDGLNFGKLRLSAAMQHIDYVPIQGLWLENYNGGGGDYYLGAGAGQQIWGTFIGYQPTKDFKLETAYKFNLGTDLRLAKALDVNFDVYYQYRDNILLSGDGLNSSVMGIPSGYVNRGRVGSYGVELGLNFVKNPTSDVSYNVGVNFTYGRNEILRTIENVAYDYLSAEGGRVNQAWGLEAIGFFKDEADIAASPRQEFDLVSPGDFKYKDQNGDNVINENDVVRMGYDTSTPELNGSLNVGFRYKSFGFNMLWQGAGMYTQYLGTTGVWTPLVNGANLTNDYYKKSWDISDNPTYPRLTSQHNSNNYRANSVWYKNINYLKLRNCELYYLLSESFVSKARMSQCKLFVKGENLATFSNMKVMDPENIGTNYPTLMGINIGLSVTF